MRLRHRQLTNATLVRLRDNVLQLGLGNGMILNRFPFTIRKRILFRADLPLLRADLLTSGVQLTTLFPLVMLLVIL